VIDSKGYTFVVHSQNGFRSSVAYLRVLYWGQYYFSYFIHVYINNLDYGIKNSRQQILKSTDDTKEEEGI